MAVELVTGVTGSAHVSSDDAAHLNAGLVGRGSYVLGAAPEVSMSDANTLSIPACDLVLEGRHVRLTGTTEAKVASGGQAAWRRDLVCVRYAIDQSRQTESASVVVVQGRPASSAGAARDPEPPNAGSILALDPTVDVPVARVTLAGLSPAAEWLLPELPALAGLVPSGGTILPNGCWWERRGDLLVIQLVNVTCRNGATRTVGTLPEAVRPREAIRADGTAAIGVIANDGSVGLVYCNVSGAVTAFVSGNSASGDYTGQLVVALG